MRADQQLTAVAGFSPGAAPRRPPIAPPGGWRDTDGVALILVLGAVALLMLLAVSFAISMRTERLAAGNYADTVRTRQLAQVGLVRAMDEIARSMGTNLFHTNGARVYPPWTVANASGGKIVSNQYDKLLVGATTNFIPRSLLAEATPALANSWVEIRTRNVSSVTGPITNLTTNYDQTLMGRVGYLIINCSGLLDANFAGGTNRLYGTNAAEIALTDLPEIGSAADNLLNKRKTDIRYETLKELHELSGASQPASFFIYSYFPAGYWTGTTTNYPVNLAGSAAALALRKSRIIQAFRDAGLTNAAPFGEAAGILYTNLLDYLDDDNRPDNWKTAVERVPMISEVAVSNRLVQIDPPPSATYQSVAEVAIEWWYPFVKAPGDSFSIRCSATPVPTDNPVVLIAPPGGPLPQQPLIWPWQSPPFTPATNSLGVVHMALEPILPVTPDYINFLLTNLVIEVVRVDGTVVDRVEGIVLSNACSYTTPTPQVSWTRREVIDPRFNFNARDTTNQWAAQINGQSLGMTNAATTNYRAIATNNCDGDLRMYVADSTNLHSVGELGYLAFAPWRTVKLYGANLHRVLDTFAMGTNDSDIYVTHSRRGLVNPNSEVPEALAAVFAGMPVDEYPGGPSNRLSLVSARNVADQIISGPICTNLSDFGRGLTNLAALGADNELKKESFFRNSCGLLSVRQNLFAILIEAQLAYVNIFPTYMNMAHQRAVAVVWRDPYTGEFFLRSFQWLED